MKPLSKHIAFETLADLAEGRASAADREAATLHLSSCDVCSDQISQLKAVMNLMHSDKSEEVPRDVVQYAINLFHEKQPEPEKSFLRRLVATLTFDSLTAAPEFGVRSARAHSRQLLFSAAEHDIELRMILQEDEWIVAGQVLRPECVGGQVEMAGPSGSTVAPLNELCEFTLSAMPPGNYLLRVKMADIEIEVPELVLKAQ
jgi:hypothetical protein